MKHGLRDNHLQIIKHILQPFAGKIELVGLFGSRATGAYRNNSDIDLVFYGELSEAALDRIYSLFSESLLPFSVDVVAYNLITQSPLREHIDAVMQPLMDRKELLGE
jgi:uncharacterized protein